MSPPALLLHGQPGSASDWDRVAAALSAEAVIAFDRPGWDGRRRAADLAGNAYAAIAELDARGLERAVVVGHSFGGAVATWIAARHPERVAGMVLLAPSANIESLYAIDRLLAAPVIGPALTAVVLGTAGWALTAGYIRKAAALDERYLAAAGRRLRSRAAWRSFVIEQRALIADLPRLEPALELITTPTRILIGTRDRIVPLSSAASLARTIPGALLTVLEGEGHLLQMRRADAVAKAIAELLQAA